MIPNVRTAATNVMKISTHAYILLLLNFPCKTKFAWHKFGMNITIWMLKMAPKLNSIAIVVSEI